MRIELDDGDLLIGSQFGVHLFAGILDHLFELLFGHAAGIHFVVVRTDERYQTVILLLQHQGLQDERHIIDLRLYLLGVDVLSRRTEQHRFATTFDIQESVFVQHT